MLSLRCSKLPLVMACPASAVEDAFRVEPADDSAARLGTAVHHVLTNAVKGQHVEVSDACKMFGVEDVEEAERLCNWGWRAWTSIMGHFPSPETEVPLEFIDEEAVATLTGHADVLSVVAEESQLRLCDYKSGRLDSDHVAQLRGYAFLALKKYPDADSVYACVIRVRDQTVDGWVWTRKEMDAWYARFVERVKERSVYAPGPHCGHCPRGATCPAKTAVLTQACSALSLGGIPILMNGLPDDPAERGSSLLTALERAKMVQRCIDLLTDLVKADVSAYGGSVPTKEGGELRLVETLQKQLDPCLAWQPLVEAFGEEAVIHNAVKIGKGAVEDLARAGAPRGRKWQAVQDIFRRLDEAGAATSKPVVRLEVRRAVEQQPQINNNEVSA